jgi:hypothetical protein
MLSVVAPNNFVIQVAKDTQILVDAQNGMRKYFPAFRCSRSIDFRALLLGFFASRVTRPIEELSRHCRVNCSNTGFESQH